MHAIRLFISKQHAFKFPVKKVDEALLLLVIEYEIIYRQLPFLPIILFIINLLNLSQAIKVLLMTVLYIKSVH